jgi:phosphohistidine phosphatase SixA
MMRDHHARPIRFDGEGWSSGRRWPRYFARRTCTLITVAVVILLTTPELSADEDAALWKALRTDGHVALLRHAIAPGSGDPPEFTLRDCSTQRNLSDEGREQAVRIGARLRANGIDMARVFSSQWCRCLETARLLGFGAVEELPSLNSFYQRYARRDAQTDALEEWIAERNLDGPHVLVTHQVNISALTDVYPREGSLVVVRRAANGALSVVGTIDAD